MNSIKISQYFIICEEYCYSENYSGWDPFDGLNSKAFQSTPFKNWDLARLIFIQLFKRNPVNLRRFALIPKEHNAKGIGLFLSGYCNIYKLQEKQNTSELGSQELILEKINYLANLLISMQSTGYSGACWGYNFDWQARRLFLFPKNTPTVVATTYCATALFDAYSITGNDIFLQTALSSANFILKDLNRTTKKRGFLFSYSPLEGNNTVYNASLLGSKLLSYCYHYSKIEEYKLIAKESIEACVAAQSADGSWVYGELPVQNWIDSYHTGYNLDALACYQELTGDVSYNQHIEKGFEYYIKTFFFEDGTPKHFHNKTYPIDIHCPGQLLVTVNRLNKYSEYKALLDKVINWTIINMQSPKGYFYYQIKKGLSSKIPYMRWSNAFMFNALSHYFLSQLKTESNESMV